MRNIFFPNGDGSSTYFLALKTLSFTDSTGVGGFAL